ncbi:glycosyltransferase family 32 protein [Lampropedia cohaerens]|nr:capsular polysaccharide synthesis protein [Lampropedia cohaerens]
MNAFTLLSHVLQIGLGLLLAIALAVMVWLRQCSRLAPLPVPQQRILGRGAQSGELVRDAIPKVIWTYWHSESLPLVVQCCIQGWRRLHPHWRIEVLHPGRVHEFLDAIPAGLTRLNIAKQTDWIRLALLQRYGGVWIDASIILTRPLDWVEQLRAPQQADFVGFYLDGYTIKPDYPVIESWFLAAVPGSAFVTQWLALFQRAAIDGNTEDYLSRLRNEGRYADLIQRIGEPSYHTIHVVAQDVLQRHPADRGPWQLALLRAEESAYWLQWQSHWKRRPLFAKLLWARGDDGLWPALVKLRGGERSKLEFWLQRGWYRKGSLVDLALNAMSRTSLKKR